MLAPKGVPLKCKVSELRAIPVDVEPRFLYSSKTQPPSGSQITPGSKFCNVTKTLGGT